MPKLRAFLTLSGENRRLLIEACARILFAWGALKLRPFAHVVSSLDAPRHAGAPVDQTLIRRVRWAVEAAARHLPLSLTCLPQAFAASWMLQARGFAPRMHYGVAVSETGGFEAHAWVELDGISVVGQRAAPHFTLLTSFPQSKEIV
jgi:hypothetical protein